MIDKYDFKITKKGKVYEAYWKIGNIATGCQDTDKQNIINIFEDRVKEYEKLDTKKNLPNL